MPCRNCGITGSGCKESAGDEQCGDTTKGQKEKNLKHWIEKSKCHKVRVF